MAPRREGAAGAAGAGCGANHDELHDVSGVTLAGSPARAAARYNGSEQDKCQ